MPDVKSAELEFSLVRGGPFRRLRNALGLVPAEGLGLVRRIGLLVAIGWLPVVVGALIEGRMFGGGGDPLLRHFGVHTRMLISLPLLLVAEALMDRRVPVIVRHFVGAGLVDEAAYPGYVATLRKAETLRDSVWGTVLVVAAVAFAVWASASGRFSSDEMAWAGGELKFAGTWYMLVSRPLFAGMIALWAWRLLAGWLLLRDVSKLKLRLVASHPDRAGGLGFVEELTKPEAVIVLALSSVLAARWAHDVMYHGVHVDSLHPLVAAFVALMLILFLGPFLLLSKNLRGFKRHSLLEYGSLVGYQGWLVHEKWIRQQDVRDDDKILEAHEIGPVADAITMFEVVEEMRIAPISKFGIIPIVAAALIPMLPVFAIEIPLKELLLKLLGALV